MVTKNTAKGAVKVPKKRDDETSTEKFLRECAERAALPEPKKVRVPRKNSVKTAAKHPLSPAKEKSSTLTQILANMSKRERRELLMRANPWLFRPEEIRKQVQKQVRKEHSLAFTKQLGLVLSLSFKVSDLFEMDGAMNPGLSQAQEDGTIEQELWKAIRELNEAWKKLIEIV